MATDSSGVVIPGDFYGGGRPRVAYSYRIVSSRGSTVPATDQDRSGVLVRDNGDHRGEVIEAAGPADTVDAAVHRLDALGVPRAE